jgi:hypothetical protein
MLLDRENQYSDSQALAAAAVSTNVIDHQVADTGLGAGEPLMIMLSIETAAALAADLEFSFETSVDEAFTTPVVLAQGTVPASENVAGHREYLPLPPNFRYLQYTRLNYTTVSGEVVSAYLVPQSLQEEYHAFPDNTTITG